MPFKVVLPGSLHGWGNGGAARVAGKKDGAMAERDVLFSCCELASSERNTKTGKKSKTYLLGLEEKLRHADSSHVGGIQAWTRNGRGSD